MAEKVDLSLDDIIKMNRKNKNQRPGAKKGPIRKTGTGGGGANSTLNPRKRLQNLGTRSKIVGTAKGGPKNLTPRKESAMLHVSNLHFNVSNEDIKELFAEVGQIRKATVHYDKSGRSLGTAEVIYSNREAAIRAIKKYHNLPLDGRPMNITLVPSKTKVSTSPLGGLKKRQQGIYKKQQTNSSGNGYRKTGNNNRQQPMKGGRPNIRGKPQGKREPRKQLTAEQLDADLEAYNESQNAMQ